METVDNDTREKEAYRRTPPFLMPAIRLYACISIWYTIKDKN